MLVTTTQASTRAHHHDVVVEGPGNIAAAELFHNEQAPEPHLGLAGASGASSTRSPPPASSSPTPAGAPSLYTNKNNRREICKYFYTGLLRRRRCGTDHLQEEPPRDLQVPLPGLQK